MYCFTILVHVLLTTDPLPVGAGCAAATGAGPECACGELVEAVAGCGPAPTLLKQYGWALCTSIIGSFARIFRCYATTDLCALRKQPKGAFLRCQDMYPWNFIQNQFSDRTVEEAEPQCGGAANSRPISSAISYCCTTMTLSPKTASGELVRIRPKCVKRRNFEHV